MRIIGWILTILGIMLCFGALVQFVNGELFFNDSKIATATIAAIVLSILVLVIGLMILKRKK